MILSSLKKPHLLYPDFTVGTGVTPVQPIEISSWTLTTGRELHPAPEDESIFFLTLLIIVHFYEMSRPYSFSPNGK